MKARFNTYDIICNVAELQRLVGMRVNQVYDIDNKSYLIRLQRSEEKVVLLMESGIRFHTTQYDWPKNVAPSGFTMKLRKHLKNKRLESLTQLGIDRIVDFQFGTGEVAFHIILELYDRGNIVLTDYEWTILNVLRPHVEGDSTRLAVKEKYPLEKANLHSEPPLGDKLIGLLTNCKQNDNLKKILNPNVAYGPAIIDHMLQENGLGGNMKITKDPGKGFNIERDIAILEKALKQMEELLVNASKRETKGYIIQKKEQRAVEDEFLLTNVEFHPILFAQHKNQPYVVCESFDKAVDEFYSAAEGQKIDLKTVQVERQAMKKLENVKKDHEKRLTELEQVQFSDRAKAELLMRNQELVEQARTAIQTALANQMSWEDINKLVKTAQERNDPVASVIAKLKLETNHITLLLTDPFNETDFDDEENLKQALVDVDLALTAYANARRYYDQKRSAAKKQQKTLESQDKALKSVEKKTKQTLKEAQTISNISKARKTYWFEKFFWFISSDNFLVIGGRDQQQNELIVKRYLRTGDIYVHADVVGAASLVIRCGRGREPPPRTISEAGQAAVAYSVSWEAKVLTSAWWVHAHQVSKSAPTGEYLGTGSFMIRGKKTYILPQQLMLGFSFVFRLEDGSIERHKNDRKALESEGASDIVSTVDQEEEILVSDDGEEESDSGGKITNSKDLNTIVEETNQIEIKDENNYDTNHTQDNDTNDAEINDDVNDAQVNDEEVADESLNSAKDSDSDNEGVFDTHIKVDHQTGKVLIESKSRTISDVSELETPKLGQDVVFSFPPLPKKGQKKGQKGQKDKNQEPEKQQGLKRGQKGRLKKMKEKYRHQDEEDRKLRMEFLQSANPHKEDKKPVKKTVERKAAKLSKQQKIPMPAPLLLEGESDPEEPELESEAAVDVDTELLCQLTGAPYDEDELLFAVPVVAPYSALANYKYRVKLTPGTGKKGKAAKTAVQVFLRDKASTARIKDLLKAVKDENLARNFPGKVKLSAPQLHKHKK